MQDQTAVHRMGIAEIETDRGGAFQADSQLRASLLGLATPGYAHPEAMGAREMAHCDPLYFARDDSAQVVCLFLTAVDSVDVEGQGPLPALYMGLSTMPVDGSPEGAGDGPGIPALSLRNYRSTYAAVAA